MEFYIDPTIDIGSTRTGYLVDRWPSLLLFYWLNWNFEIHIEKHIQNLPYFVEKKFTLGNQV